MTTEAPGKASTWTADPMHSIAEFAVKHLVVTTVKGRFRELEATLNIDEAKPENSSVEAKIAGRSFTRKTQLERRLSLLKATLSLALCSTSLMGHSTLFARLLSASRQR